MGCSRVVTDENSITQPGHARFGSAVCDFWVSYTRPFLCLIQSLRNEARHTHNTRHRANWPPQGIEPPARYCRDTSKVGRAGDPCSISCTRLRAAAPGLARYRAGRRIAHLADMETVPHA